MTKMLAKLFTVCGIAGIASAQSFEDYVEGLPGSAGVTADTNRECSLIELSWMAAAMYALQDYDSIQAGCDDLGSEDGFYCDHFQGKGWVSAEELPQSTYDVTADTVLAMAVFTNTEKKLAVLSIKGTSPTSTSDQEIALASVIMGSDPLDTLKKAAELVAKYQDQDWNVMVTGHSMGGYMAEVVATRLQISGVGFCAPGSHTVNPLANNHGGAAHAGFQNVNYEHDPLGNMGPGVYTHPQWSVFVEDHSPLPEHRVTKMVAAMTARGFDWTNLNVVSKCYSGLHGYYTNLKHATASTVRGASSIGYAIIGLTVLYLMA